jgi:ribosomal protein S20
MPKIKSNIKSLKQDKKRRMINVHFRSQIKNSYKKLLNGAKEGGLKESELKTQLARIYTLCDRASDRGYIKKNKGGRIKSRATKVLKVLEGSTKKEKENAPN